MPSRRRLARLLAAPWVAVLAVACAINPVTGERQLSLISEEQEIAIGREAAGQVAQSIGLVRNDALQEYVERVGLALARESERPELPWQFRVVDDAAPNAFALPGGYIYVTRGLMGLLASEAELAAVLGHEIGHVTARHSVTQLSRAQLAQLGLGLGLILSPELAQFGELLGGGLQLLFLKYGRDDERQADDLGFRYMLGEGYDVSAMADVFRALMGASELAGRSPLPTWLASHPAEAERIENAARRAAALEERPSELRVGAASYLEALDGMIYGENPRNGFFRDDWFHHPELVFRFRVPEAWQRRNLPAVVQAASPEGDAGLELSIVQADEPVEAANRFFARQGVALLGGAREAMHGNPAVLSEFQAQTEGGLVRGYVAHVAHGRAVYQLVAYATSQGFGRRAGQLREIVTSFSPERDREVLEVEPRRIEIVELARSMTLSEFAREYPSAVSLEELALINQVDPSTALPAGARLKRVTGQALD